MTPRDMRRYMRFLGALCFKESATRPSHRFELKRRHGFSTSDPSLMRTDDKHRRTHRGASALLLLLPGGLSLADPQEASRLFLLRCTRACQVQGPLEITCKQGPSAGLSLEKLTQPLCGNCSGLAKKRFWFSDVRQTPGMENVMILPSPVK